MPELPQIAVIACGGFLKTKRLMQTDLKIFLVEFGKPDLSNYTSFGNRQDPLFVLAKSFDEASQKAFIYAENKLNNEKSKSVLDSDGSLRLDTTEMELQVKSVKMVSNEIIM